jgi:signal transduction histidine kinase
MRIRTRAGLAWGLLGLYVLLVAAAVALAALNDLWGQIGWIGSSVTFPVVGALIASRVSGAVGWICLGIGLAVAFAATCEEYTVYALRTNPGSLPGGTFTALYSTFSWVTFIVPIAVFLVLLFPDGKPPSRRWRPVAWLAVGAAACALTAFALSPGKLDGAPVEADNPVGIDAKGLLNVIAWAGIFSIFACIIASAVSIVVRYRRSRGDERQQLKWFVTAVGLAVGLFFLTWPAGLVSTTLVHAFEVLSLLGWTMLPLAAGIAILRYRLYDIDLVINKALVFGVLAAFLTAVYVAIVVGFGTLVGRAGGSNVALSILATAVVAVAFQPVRERARRLANRLVYGHRATPYDVLAQFSEQAAATVPSEELLLQLARTVGEGTGAARSEVWVRSGDDLRLAASWPDRSPGRRRMALEDGQLPTFAAADRAVAVRHRDELLGALTITNARGHTPRPAEEKLLSDLAAQAGLVLRNVGLTAELLARLDDLQASRQRLVSAQDEERRRLERDLHDGAQQHLVGLKVKLHLASRQAGETPLKDALASLQADADEAIEALRALAHGIYPPLLAELGLAAAIEAHARKAPIDVAVESDGIVRYSEATEAALYFCCLEALQNVTKYAGASRAVVRLAQSDGRLNLAVSDDGAGFDPAAAVSGAGLQNMSDRVEALGGVLSIVSAQGQGTTVIASLPLSPMDEPAAERPARALDPHPAAALTPPMSLD